MLDINEPFELASKWAQMGNSEKSERSDVRGQEQIGGRGHSGLVFKTEESVKSCCASLKGLGLPWAWVIGLCETRDSSEI